MAHLDLLDERRSSGVHGPEPLGHLDEDGSDGPPCLEIFNYGISSNGKFSVISDEFGCATSGTMTVGADSRSTCPRRRSRSKTAADARAHRRGP
jgi:hypothetical protein